MRHSDAIAQAFHRRPLVARIDKQPAFHTVKNPQSVEQQVIDRANQKAQAGEQQQLPLQKIEKRQNLIACHGHAPPVRKSRTLAMV